MYPPLSAHRILVVDDDLANLRLLKQLLTLSDYKVALAQNGPDALDAAARRRPDLILLDVKMPGIDGYEVCRRLKADPATCHIPVIFISGLSDERKGFQAGAVDYIRKPLSPNIVRARVKNHLELKQYRDYLEGMVTERTRALETANRRLQEEISVRKQAEAELKKYRDHLEALVRQRTADLVETNARLEQEIAERRQTEKQLKESEEKYRSVFENTGSATVILEEDMTISMVNAECERLTGYPKEEIQGKRKWKDFVADHDRLRMSHYHSRRRRGQWAPATYECALIDAFGQTKDVLVQVDMIPGTTRSVASWIDITERKRAGMALRESEAYLRKIMATIQAGVMIVDPETRRISDVNPCAAGMIGCPPEELIGSDYHQYVRCECGQICGNEFTKSETCRKGENCDCIIHTAGGDDIHVRRSYAPARLRGRDYVIQSFLDITDIKRLLKKQDINIDLSKNILNLVNRTAPRHTRLPGGLSLFSDALSVPCHKQGGDHYFLRNLTGEPGSGRTILSLKDQSGHEVGCVLRSIMTDLIHHAILTQCRTGSFENTVTRLNREICRSAGFRPEDFFTAINAEINHDTLMLRYSSAGHPPFLLIRNGTVRVLPGAEEAGTNIPMGISDSAIYTAGTFQLRPADRLIFYTDGLTEMPENKQNRTIRPAELSEIISVILRDEPGATVSDLMYRLLDRVADMSHETVRPFSVNTSGDDITLLCLEIEDDSRYHEIRLRPETPDEVMRMAENLYAELASEWSRRGYEAPDARLWAVLEEGLLNAWHHGNRGDPRKCIVARWRYGNDFHFELTDQGRGFDPTGVADPTADENVSRMTGRGIFMIRYFSDSARWEAGGRCLRVSFKKRQTPLTEAYRQYSEQLMKLWAPH